MRPRTLQLTSWLFSAVLAAAMSPTLACSSDKDTVLALTIASNQGDVGAPANLRVTVTPTSGDPVTETFVPDIADGAIVMSFFRRITLNGRSGTATVTVEALDAGGTAYLTATTTATLIENGAVAARVELMAPPPPPDGGTGDGGTNDGGADDGGDDAGTP